MLHRCTASCSCLATHFSTSADRQRSIRVPGIYTLAGNVHGRHLMFRRIVARVLLRIPASSKTSKYVAITHISRKKRQRFLEGANLVAL